MAQSVRTTILLPADLDKKLRRAVFDRKGLRQGVLTEAMIEAVELWLSTNPKASRKP